jgi:hypothetical protein
MKPAFVRLSPAAAATVAAAIGVALSAVLLLGMGVPGEPTPLFTASSGVAGRVAADLPAAAHKLASERVGITTSSAPVVATRTEHFVVRRRQTPTTSHRVRGSARTRVTQPAPSVAARVAAPAAPTPPVVRRRFSNTARSARGKAHGRGRLKPRLPRTARPKTHGGAPQRHYGGGNGHEGGKDGGGNGHEGGKDGGGNGHKGGKK